MKTWLFQNTLKRKVFLFVLVILVCFLTGFIYTFYATYKVNEQINEMFSTSIMLNEMQDDMNTLEVQLENYLATKNSDSFVQYLNMYNALGGMRTNFSYGKSNDPSRLQLHNIGMLLDAYLEKAELAIEFKRARNTERYLESYSELLTVDHYINLKVKQLEEWDFETNLENYLLLTEKVKLVQNGLILMVGLLISLSVLFVFTFSTNVTRPIVELSNRARAISEGQYTFGKIEGEHFKEAQVLESAFDNMAMHIKNYIEELRDKVDTENKLRLSEIEKLRMQNLLNQAELMALQAQINPHFLFNTLNAGMQLAIIENADRTSSFLEDLSQLFRYNIQSLENKVTLKEELVNVQNYCSLMKVRFGEQFIFDFDIDEATLQVEMPPLILQPIIENALIHGFKNRTGSGLIQIMSAMDHNNVRIEVKDNGEGIDRDILERLNNKEFEKNADKKGYTTGLGLGNVYDRLKHFFNREELFFIDSKKEAYTSIILWIPLEGSDNL